MADTIVTRPARIATLACAGLLATLAGCASVAVSYGAHQPETFDALSPLFVAHSVAGLQTWLLQNG